MIWRSLAAAILVANPALSNDVASGRSPDPVAELNALFGKICNWDEDTRLVPEVVNFSDDGLDDYLITYDLPCRGQDNAFSGIHGTARQIWASAGGAEWVRILDVNARDLTIETRDDGLFVVLQHAGSYCLMSDSAPCFLTLHYNDGALTLADEQHPSMSAKLKKLQEENDK
ncbi:MAG: hypothetical protein AAF393_10025 [Pseudomonadota bacterium]